MNTFQFRIIIPLALFFAAKATMVGQDMTDPGLNPIGNPTSPITSTSMGPPTVPASSYQGVAVPGQGSGLLNGNLIITGNVSGGQYFHDYIPYGSPLDFRGSLETTSLDSFLRYSAPPGQTFYSPTASPAGYGIPAAGGLLAGPSQKIRTSGTTEDYFVPLSSVAASMQQTSAGTSTITLLPTVTGNYQTLLNRVQGYRGVEQFITKRSKETEADLMKPVEQEDLLKTELEKTDLSEPLKPFEQPAQAKAAETITSQVLQKPEKDDFTKMRLQADEQIKKAVEEEWASRLKAAGLDKTKLPRKDQTARTGAVMDSAPAGQMFGKPTKKFPTFESEFGDKFDHFINSAEQYMKEGKFYQAADSYTMASIYRPLEPLGYAGKSLALFAAGEYLSSSRMLSVALELKGEYAKTKLDLENLFSDKTILETRVADLQKWTKASESPELLFLLAFIDYQTGKTDQASSAIDLALQKMPERKAMLALKKVIDQSAVGETSPTGGSQATE
jgi:tetratricopeptide (TPR) repeat protein